MKVLIANSGYSAHYYERLGLSRSANYSGHESLIFDTRAISPFDIFDSYEPDIFIGQGFELNSSFLQCIKERPKLKIYLKVGDDGDERKHYPEKYQILVASEEERKNVRAILEMGNEVIVGCHYIQERLHTTHNFWEEMGCKLLSQMMAADIFDYCNGVELPEFKSDIFLCSGFWEYKSINLKKYLFPLFNPKYNYNIKIFGNSAWPTHYYNGPIDTNLVRHGMKSAVICPHIAEPHVELGAEISERPFKILSNKCFCVADWGQDIAKVFSNGEMMFAKTADEFHGIIRHFLSHPHECESFKERGYNTVINSHTYFHRLKSLFQAFELDTKSIDNGLERARVELCV